MLAPIELAGSEYWEARRLLKNAAHVLVITGAGISEESGIPTFRGPRGIWNDPGLIRDLADRSSPEQFLKNGWKWTYRFRMQINATAPNRAHRALAAWVRSRGNTLLVTQNVDGLHERAGHQGVIAMHGSLWMNRCLRCNNERFDATLHAEGIPRSPCCRAPERPSVVLFGEDIPGRAIERVVEVLPQTDVLLVIGTSGQVMPASEIIRLAFEEGKTVIDVNPERLVQSHFHFPYKASEFVPLLF